MTASRFLAALASSGGGAAAVGLASEADVALALAAGALTVGLASEADTALALGAGAAAPVGLAAEADTALALVAGGPADIRLQPSIDLQRGGYAASLSGLRWWVLDAAMTAVEASGTGLTTDTSGRPTIDIDASASWGVGDYVPLWIADYEAGTAAPDRTVRTFFGFVPAVAQP